MSRHTRNVCHPCFYLKIVISVLNRRLKGVSAGVETGLWLWKEAVAGEGVPGASGGLSAWAQELPKRHGSVIVQKRFCGERIHFL